MSVEVGFGCSSGCGCVHRGNGHRFHNSLHGESAEVRGRNRMRRTAFLLPLALALAALGATADKTLTPEEAKNHIGENATVCGPVAGTHYAASSRGAPVHQLREAVVSRQR
jgi:hypothetical protein